MIKIIALIAAAYIFLLALCKTSRQADDDAERDLTDDNWSDSK